MRLNNIPDPILKDMLATLQGDAPILFENWYKRVDPIYDTPPCGCLMMDNHVEEFLDACKSEDFYEPVVSVFLAEVYTKKLARSSNYRGYVVTSCIIDGYAKQFDKWCEKDNSYFIDPKDDLRYPKVHNFFGHLKDGSKVKLFPVLTDEARVYLAGLIKATLRERRKDPSLHDYVRSTLLARRQLAARDKAGA